MKIDVTKEENRGFEFISDLKPTEAEQAHAKALWNWFEESKQSTIVLGEPMTHFSFSLSAECFME